jgi:hypothetical protein
MKVSEFTVLRVYITVGHILKYWKSVHIRCEEHYTEYHLTEMSTRNLTGGKGRRRVRLTTSPPSRSRLSRENVGASTSHNTIGLRGVLQRLLYLLRSIKKSEMIRDVPLM